MNEPVKIPAALRTIGTRPLRTDGTDKVTGTALFADDIHLANMLHGKTLRSPHAHARIVSIDTSKAAVFPGVQAVVTGADFPVLEHQMVNQNDAGYVDIRDISDNCMAQDKVLYDGHAVAAVAAESPHVAEQALALIDVEYELLPPLLDVRSAMAEDAPVIHAHFFPGAFIAPTEEFLPNASRLQVGTGDLEQGFAEADLIIEREYTAETVHQGYIEGHITTVNWSNKGQITVWTSSQGQFEIRDTLAAVLEVPIAIIKVVPMEVGGAFGGKERIYMDPVAALLSKKSARPVKMAMSRNEVLRATGPSPGAYIKVKIGAKSDGCLTAAHVHMAFEAGAYAGCPIFLGMMSATTRYNIPNVRIDGFDVIVNKPKTRPYRAPGGPQALFAVEQAIDELAELVQMDPIDIRIKNLTKTGDRLIPGIPCPAIDTEAVLECLRSHPHYTAPLKKPQQGRGLAYAFKFNIGATSSARISVNADGSVQLATGGPDMSGSRMTLAMQAAEALGIEVSDVSSSVGDTESVSFSRPTIGSRTTFATGIVVIDIAQEVLKEMAARAALLWEIDPEQVDVSAGTFRNILNPEQKTSFKDLAGKLDEIGGSISVSMTKTLDGMVPQAAAHLVDVAVDADTGKVDILRYTVFQDVGKAVHPDYVEGQMQGSAVQGIGMALNEEYFYDGEGHLRNASLLDYRMPTSLDLPMIDTVILESPNPSHPFGVRGCGEVSIMPAAAAIANAIYDAVGVRVYAMPMAPHKICAAIQARGSQQK